MFIRAGDRSALGDINGINDYIEIAAIAVAYGYAADAISSGDAEEGRRIIKECFIDGATFDAFAPGQDPSTQPMFSHRFPDAWINAGVKMFASMGYKATQHHMGDILIHVEGDTATMQTCITGPHILDGSRVLDFVTGIYTDRLERTPDGWKIAHRRLNPTSFLRLEAAGASSDTLARAEAWRRTSSEGAARSPQSGPQAVPRRVTTDERSLRDRMEIEALAVSYAHAADAASRGDVEEGERIIKTCFTDAAVFEGYLHTSDPSGPPDYRIIGHDAWAAACAGLGYRDAQHQMGNIQIDVRGDEATTRCCLLGIFIRRWSSDIDFCSGTYTDRLVRTPNGWRFAHRKFVLTSLLTLKPPPSGAFERQLNKLIETMPSEARPKGGAPEPPGHGARVAEPESSGGGSGDVFSAFRDHTEIASLGLAYANAADALGRGDVEEGRALSRTVFARDAVYEVYLPSDDPDARPILTLIGPDAFADHVRAGFASIGYTATQHHIGNIQIHIDGDKATMRSCVIATHVIDPSSSIALATATYTDEVVRTEQGWKFARRALRVTSSMHLESPPKSAVEAPMDALTKAMS